MKLLLREEALEDLASIRDWYLARNPAVARSLIARVKARLLQLETFPYLGEAVRERAERVLTISGTPLLVIYGIDADARLVDVIAVIDGRRDPESRFRD